LVSWFVFLAQPRTTVQKKGRVLNAPLTQGTAKRPSREARQDAPDGRVLTAGPLDLKFAVSE
jgi:hypothetical protein